MKHTDHFTLALYAMLSLIISSCSPTPEVKSSHTSPGHDSSEDAAKTSGLSWEITHHQSNYHPKQGELLLLYPFTVTGTKAVTIKSVTPDCDCLVVPLPQKTFQPGKTSQLEVKFLAGTRTGKQERVIEVQLEGHEKTIKLTATIEVPEIIAVAPKSLSWKVGEQNKSKEITLSLSEALKITSSQSSSKHFEIELIESSPNKIWTIKITPKDTNKPRSSMVMLRTDYPHRPWDRLAINARIEP